MPGPAVGRVDCRINNAYAATLINPNASHRTPVTTHKLASGRRVTAQGIPDDTAQLQVYVPVEGPEFNLETLSAAPNGFSITYRRGAQTIILTQCRVSNEADKVDNGNGNVTITYDITAGERLVR